MGRLPSERSTATLTGFRCAECDAPRFDTPELLGVHLERHREVTRELVVRGKVCSVPCPKRCGRHVPLGSGGRARGDWATHIELCDGSAPLPRRRPRAAKADAWTPGPTLEEVVSKIERPESTPAPVAPREEIQVPEEARAMAQKTCSKCGEPGDGRHERFCKGKDAGGDDRKAKARRARVERVTPRPAPGGASTAAGELLRIQARTLREKADALDAMAEKVDEVMA